MDKRGGDSNFLSGSNSIDRTYGSSSNFSGENLYLRQATNEREEASY